MVGAYTIGTSNRDILDPPNKLKLKHPGVGEYDLEKPIVNV